MKSQTRNVNPRPEAVCAMYLFSGEYARLACGSMDFYDGLDKSRKRLATDMARAVIGAARNHGVVK